MHSILFSKSPIARFAAEVCTENECSYFYLYQMEPQAQKLNTLAACWIKNHATVEDGYSPKEDMLSGMQPKIPTSLCRYPQDLSLFQEEELEIVWGEEGCLAGLYQNGELICVVPYWAEANFTGYSKYSNTDKMGIYPLPLQNGNAMFDRLEAAARFWQQDFSAVWESYQQEYLEDLTQRYGKPVKYYGIDGGHFPPRGLVVFEKSGYRLAFTIGMGLFTQPSAELYHKDSRLHDHVELAFGWKADLPLEPTRIYSQISSIAAIPWMYKTFLDHHHTIDLNVDQVYQNAVFISDQQAKVLNSTFLREKQINLLWLMPISESLCQKLTAEEPDYAGVEQQLEEYGVMLEHL